MHIRILGAHNCESQNSRFASVLIDDVLAIDAGGLTSSLSFSAQQGLKAILLTHQHYDHVRDIPAVAMNLFLQGATINVYCTRTVYQALASHLLDGALYPKFQEKPEADPTVKFTVIEPYQLEKIEGYDVLAVPVNHGDGAVGYQVTSPHGETVFYAGDTGPGLTECWERVAPQLLVIEVTLPDRYQEYAAQSRHLTPVLLRQELTAFFRLKGYLPEVMAIHMNPTMEREIEPEIAEVARALDISISLACEGLELEL
ncbi:MBL fold metallo-hydrolase [Chloroflexota bacterium]